RTATSPPVSTQVELTSCSQSRPGRQSGCSRRQIQSPGATSRTSATRLRYREPAGLRPREPALVHQPVDEIPLPPPGPREPALRAGPRADHGGVYAGDDELRAAAAAPRLPVQLVPTGELGHPVAVHLEEPRDDRTAALERRAERLQLLRLEVELALDVLGER